MPAADGLPRDGRWSCGTHDYPSMHHSLMHPCAYADANCCGNSRSAPFLLRYESFFHSQNALLVLAYEVGLLSAFTPSHAIAVAALMGFNVLFGKCLMKTGRTAA